MANSSAKSPHLRHYSASSNCLLFPQLSLFFLLLLLPIFCGTTQKTGLETESEIGQQHELEEGSGDMFNPDDEDDLEASGMAPPEETAHRHFTTSGPVSSSTMSPNMSTPRHHSAAPTRPQQMFSTPNTENWPRFAVSPTTQPPPSTSADGDEDRLRQHFHLALLFSLIVLLLALGFGSVALCCCCQRRRRRRTTGQNRSEEYSAGREQARHYL